MPNAKRFKRWVTSEVLPIIRKTGGYVANEDMFVETYLPFADEPIKQLFKLQCRVINQLNDRIRRDEPKVKFADHVSDTTNVIDMNKMAKLCADHGIRIGHNRLFAWMRSRGILMMNNIPYQEFIDTDILQNCSTFDKLYVFENEGHTCIMFPFEDVELDVGKLAMWRLQTHEQFCGTWLSDYVQNSLGGFITEEPVQEHTKPDCPLIGEDSNIFHLMGIFSITEDYSSMNSRIQILSLLLQNFRSLPKILPINYITKPYKSQKNAIIDLPW